MHACMLRIRIRVDADFSLVNIVMMNQRILLFQPFERGGGSPKKTLPQKLSQGQENDTNVWGSHASRPARLDRLRLERVKGPL